MTKPLAGRLAGSPQPAGRRPYSRRRAALPQLSGHRWLRTAVIGAGLFALAACGSPAAMNAAQTGTTTASPTTTATSPPTTSITLVPPPSSGPPPTSAPPAKATGPTVPPNQVDYAGAAESVPQTVWEQDGGKTLVVMAEEGGCVKVEAQVVKQTADEVDVALVSIAQTHRVCPLYVRNVPVAVHLDAPLGNRKVVLTTQIGTQR
ncbi:hypothetical protein [Kutzneria kofuensis]|uniref:Uncharacterized protein n=1 Tax=Kutzneria kofuensis TaxID=103725 RepID=A0A7W9KKZ4_9PSEU|nr:hypothetical protein [Kutzneria kofuensis]MBB5894527.1 hypothetical protein [Kutzneria kofuensis]